MIAAGRSETFVPIDTENIEEDQLQKIQALATETWKTHGALDAVVSADGDSDRPLILGVEPGPGDTVRGDRKKDQRLTSRPYMPLASLPTAMVTFQLPASSASIATL